MPIKLPVPDQQVDFAAALIQIRERRLQEALLAVVGKLPIREVDRELAMFAPEADLALMASKGLRGELMFAVPLVLRANPCLLSYYRLLHGYSQKAFYESGTGLSLFKAMEDKGCIPPAGAGAMHDLCRAVNASGSYLLRGLAPSSLTAALLDDLSLLTLGPQLRGGANVKKGTHGIVQVFAVISDIVGRHAVAKTARTISVVNAAGRSVLIEFAADPDIMIRETMAGDSHRNIIAMEIKAGTDFSNIHNRIGEAEKSHQKAKADGYTECWTVVNVDKIDVNLARQESPSTNRFYRLSDLLAQSGRHYEDFRNRVLSLIGLPDSRSKPRRRNRT